MEFDKLTFDAILAAFEVSKQLHFSDNYDSDADSPEPECVPGPAMPAESIIQESNTNHDES